MMDQDSGSGKGIASRPDFCRMLLDSTAEGVLSLSLDGTCTFCNRTGMMLLGYGEGELVGKNLHEMIHHSYPDGSAYPIGRCEICQAFRNGEARDVSDEVFWRKDGTSLPVEYHAVPLLQEGKVIGAVVTFLDISERKKIESALKKCENRFQAMADVSPVGMFRCDSLGNFSYVNKRWFSITCLSPEVVASSGLACIHAEDRDRVLGGWLEAAGRNGPFSSEFRIQRPDGTFTWVYGQVVAERNEAGELTGYLGTITDLTEQKRVEDVLREREQFIETITDQLPIGFAVVSSEDDTIKYGNKRMDDIMGWPKEVVRDLGHFYEHAFPDAAFRSQVRARVEADIATGDPGRMHWEFPIVKMSGENSVILAHQIPLPDRNLRIFTVQDFTDQRRAEEALLQSELRRIQLETELRCAAEIQKHLLPIAVPRLLRRFEIAAMCLPAYQVGGDFYDWHETAPGFVTFAIGDVMGKGMAAAMLMTTIRATLRAVTHRVPPAIAVRRAEQSLRHDLDSAESFVTVFLGRLNVASSQLTYVDCGHGFAFLRRCDGKVEDLLPRGLPLGIRPEEKYQEGGCVFHQGDTLVLYSDGLIDAQPEASLNNEKIGATLVGAGSAREMVDRIAATVPPEAPRPDDITIFVIRRREDA